MPSTQNIMNYGHNEPSGSVRNVSLIAGLQIRSIFDRIRTLQIRIWKIRPGSGSYLFVDPANKQYDFFGNFNVQWLPEIIENLSLSSNFLNLFKKNYKAGVGSGTGSSEKFQDPARTKGPDPQPCLIVHQMFESPPLGRTRISPISPY